MPRQHGKHQYHDKTAINRFYLRMRFFNQKKNLLSSSAWPVITHPCPTFNCSLTNLPFEWCPSHTTRFGRYVVPTLLKPTFRRNWCWFRPGATLCHDVLRCCRAITTPEPRYCPVFRHVWQVTLASLVALCYTMSRYCHAVASLSPRCSTLCHVYDEA